MSGARIIIVVCLAAVTAIAVFWLAAPTDLSSQGDADSDIVADDAIIADRENGEFLPVLPEADIDPEGRNPGHQTDNIIRERRDAEQLSELPEEGNNPLNSRGIIQSDVDLKAWDLTFRMSKIGPPGGVMANGCRSPHSLLEAVNEQARDRLWAETNERDILRFALAVGFNKQNTSVYCASTMCRLVEVGREFEQAIGSPIWREFDRTFPQSELATRFSSMRFLAGPLRPFYRDAPRNEQFVVFVMTVDEAIDGEERLCYPLLQSP